MIDTTYPSTTFQIACELGAAYLIFDLGRDPVTQVEQMQDTIKQAARYIKAVSQLPQTKCLEAISVAAGFENWYSLNQHMNKAEGFESGAPDDWTNRLTSLLPLFIAVGSDGKPSEYGLALINDFSKKLSISTGILEPILMDALFARLCHGNSWDEIMARTPLSSPIPYYAFIANDPYSSPHFQASSACNKLTEELESHGLWDGDIDLDANIARLTEILQQRPDYLDGWAWLAGIHCDYDLTRALSFADKGIAQAESLLPKGFRGKLDWGHLGNREYLRLLNTKRMIHMARGENDLGEIKKAIRIANKLMKLCPNDNMGVRHELPEMIEMREALKSDSSNSL